MTEFSGRINAQRKILQTVNQKDWGGEALFGLSSKAIDRWVNVNRLNPNSEISKLLVAASAKLFFLANKSQDAVTPEYLNASEEVARIARAIEIEIAEKA